MKQVMQVALMVTLAVLSMACQGQMNLRLDNNFGLPIYKNLGLIERRPLGVGLMIDEESKNAQVEFVSHNIHYTIALGEALAGRLMYALVLQFERVQWLENPVLPEHGLLDTLMVVKLKNIDATMKITPKWRSAALETSSWMELEAVLKDRDNQTIWVGTSHTEAQTMEESLFLPGPHDASSAISVALEETIAKLVAQLAQSDSLRDFVAQHKAKARTVVQ